MGPIQLTERQAELLTYRLYRFVCSEPWAADCREHVRSGGVPFFAQHSQLERRFHRLRIYPPGGYRTAMRRCLGCGRWMPPQTLGSSGHCMECRYQAMSPWAWSHLPSSPAFHRMSTAQARANGLAVPAFVTRRYLQVVAPDGSAGAVVMEEVAGDDDAGVVVAEVQRKDESEG